MPLKWNQSSLPKEVHNRMIIRTHCLECPPKWLLYRLFRYSSMKSIFNSDKIRCMRRFDALLRRSPFPQRKTLLHLIVKRITLDDRKRVGSVELAFNEETKKHFFSVAPSAEPIVEGAFPLPGKAPTLKNKLTILI